MYICRYVSIYVCVYAFTFLHLRLYVLCIEIELLKF